MNRLFFLAFAAASAHAVAGQLPTPKPAALVGARSLALSPDGKQLAFSYQGDIWVAPATGGRAIPVTNHIEMEDNPVWSPDGNWIAFASNRTGNWDIFAVPAIGGQTKRLTWHTGSDIPSDWSADGKSILFKATRDEPTNGIYTIDVATGRTKQIMLDPVSVGSPRYSPDGKRILYTRFGFPWVRPRYEGSAASQLWSYDLTTGKRTEWRNNGLQHLWPSFALGGKSILTVTVSEKTPSSSYVGKPIPRVSDNANRTPNIYAVDAPGRARRITDYVTTPVRFLTVSSDGQTAAYENDGDVYLMKLGEKPTKVELTATIDDKVTMEERLVLTSGASDMSLSPKGDKIAFTVRGEIWTVPTKKEKGPNADDATQLTTWEGVDEQPLYLPDGKTIFFVSDRDGANRLFRMNTETKQITPITKGNNDIGQLRLTPDKKHLSFWMAGAQGGIYTVPIEGTEIKRVVARPGNNEGGSVPSYDWSPDGRYVAYPDTLVRSGYYYWESTSNILVHDTQTGRTHNVTQLSAEHSMPTWSLDGKYLFFRSNRNGNGIYALPLKPEDARPTEMELKYEKPKTPVQVEIDFDGIETRSRRIIQQYPFGSMHMHPETGEIYFQSENDLWKASYNGEEVRRITTGGGINSFEFSDDFSQVFFTKGGTLNTLNLKAPNFPVTTVAFRADWTRDLRKERAAAYEQFWRGFNKSFYDANFHGRDWVSLRERYRKYLPSVGHRNEFATVLNMLVGELESSHSEVGAAPGNPSSQSSAHPGFTIDYGYSGPGLKVREVAYRAPGSFAKTKLNPGDIVTKINGIEVQADEALWRDVLNEQTGRELTLTVKGTDGKTRDVKYRAMSGGQYSGIVFNNLLEQRRKYVEEKSGGKLTYVHIAGMGQGPLDTFNQQVWQYAQGKKGLIIDVRNNGGGNTSDRIIDILERQPNSIYQIRDEEPMLGPGQALAMPMVVMHAESSFSNAEMFPYAMHQRKLAKTVGKTTPGYVIYTYGFQLVDGSAARMPSTGVYRMDGSPLENMGQVPDFVVDLTPEEYYAGKDPQLDKAIEVLLKEVK